MLTRTCHCVAVVLWTVVIHQVSIVVTVAESEKATLKKYGEPCVQPDDCGGDLMSCVEGLCSCLVPDEMLYDPDLNICLVDVGRVCEIRQVRQGKVRRRVTAPCVTGAECIESICKCSEGFYLDGGRCLRKKKNDEKCASDSECDTMNSQKLLCLDGKCGCSRRGQVFDLARGCVGTVGSDCDANASVFVNECTSHAECRSGKCHCQNGYAKSTSGQCGLGHGQVCDVSHPCADIYFSCINGQCACSYPLHQTYEERTEECLSMVSGPCTFPKDSLKDKTLTDIYDVQKCVKNAHCVDRGFYSECECKPGFVQTRTGTCAPGYMETCDSDECDPITPLFCRNNKCDCEDALQIFDADLRKCVGSVGSRCTVNQPSCVEFASCVISVPERPGKCLCDIYSKEIANRTCEYFAS